MKRICILSFSKIIWDSRVLREINMARNHFDVDVIGYGDWTPPDGVNYFQVKPSYYRFWQKIPAMLLGRLFPLFWDRYFWLKKEYRQAEEIIICTKPDLIHGNDFDGLPVAVRAAGKMKKKPKVIFDAHEYSLDQGSEGGLIRWLMRPYREYILRKYHAGADESLNVSEDRVELYKRHFDWDFKIILNAPDYVECEFKQVDPDHINLVHHGGAHSGRFLEDFIDMVPLLDRRFVLNFVLVSFSASYTAYIKNRAEKVAPGRIVFWDPIPPAQLVKGISRFDIGLPGMRASSLNNLYGIPNKFYECLNAGLAMAISPLPTMQKLIETNQLGIVASGQSPDEMAFALNSLTSAQINRYKQNSLKLARTMNSSTEKEKLKTIYFTLVNPD